MPQMLGEMHVLSFQKWPERYGVPIPPKRPGVGSEIGEADSQSQANNR